jgi:hypothetical protein
MRFEGLREALLAGGIAPRYVRRYLRELEDHLADLINAQRAAGYDETDAAIRARALLGNKTELAAAMLAQPGLKSLPARAPWLVFGVLPPLAIPALFMIAALPLVATANLHGMVGRNTIVAPAWFRDLAHITALIANLLLAPGVAALLVWTATRQRLSWKWPLLALILVALLGVHMGADFPQAGRRGGHINVGLLPQSPHLLVLTLAAHGPLLVAQFLLTLAPALWLARKRQSDLARR